MMPAARPKMRQPERSIVLYDTNPAPPVGCATIALAELELVATIPVPDVVDNAVATTFRDVEIAEDELCEVGFPSDEVEIPVGSEDIDVGMTIETAVAFPSVRDEAGMVASGEAVRGSLKMLQISAIAPKVANRWSARKRARHDAIKFALLGWEECWIKLGNDALFKRGDQATRTNDLPCWP